MDDREVMKTNIRVWARRFGVEIANLDNAATMAAKVYGNSRRGALLVCAMKRISGEFSLGMDSQNVYAGGVHIAETVYRLSYAPVIQPFPEREWLDKQVPSVRDWLQRHRKALDEIAAKVAAVRGAEKSAPNLGRQIRR